MINLPKSIAKIEIKPSTIKPKTLDISVHMPIWKTLDKKDGKVYIKMPLFDVETYSISDSDEDIDTAIKEAMHCFFTAADKYGGGIHKQLQHMGWQIKNKRHIRFKTNRPIVKKRQPYMEQFNFDSKEPAIHSMMSTGTPTTLSLQYAS